MTRVHTSLYACPNDYTWRDVLDFVYHLDASSALVSELHPEIAGWQGDQKIPMLLAQIADELAFLRYEYDITHIKKGAKKPPQPQRIERPGVKNQNHDQHFGAEAIPVSEFNEWWDSQG